jgi:hypothetical protein
MEFFFGQPTISRTTARATKARLVMLTSCLVTVTFRTLTANRFPPAALNADY